MNEELKIIIKAVSDEARRNLAEVRKELDRIDTSAEKSEKAVDTAMRAMGKATAMAVGSVVALTTAMVALGKSSIEFQKHQAKLNAGFQSVGLSAAQAAEVYDKLFGFLGEADTATETANLLAQLTQDTTELAEWTEILQGVYAKFPSSLPVESLAEAVNHTAQLGTVQGTLADALEWVGVNVDSFNAALEQTNSVAEREALIRNTLNSLYMGASRAYGQANQALIQYHRSQVEVDRALAEAMRYVIPLMTNLNHLAATLLTYLKPAFETVASVIIVFVQWIIAAIKAVGMFFGMFEKGSGDKVADSMGDASNNTNDFASGMENVNQALGGAVQQAKELKRQTMGFDELNVLASQSSASTSTPGIGGGGGGGINIPEIAIPDLSEGLNLPDMKAFEEKVESIRERLKAILVLVGLAGLGFSAWKATKLIQDMMVIIRGAKTVYKLGKDAVDAAFGAGTWDKINTALDDKKARLKGIIGQVLTIAGIFLLIWGYADAWVNGIDWGNFALILGGVGLIVAGLALQHGSLAGAIGLIAGGIAMLIIGIKDFIENGYSMENVLMIAAGAIAVVVGAVWAFNAALLANPITWIVVAIMALVATFIILWNECEGFRNFWIGLWEKIKVAFANFMVFFASAKIKMVSIIDNIKLTFLIVVEAIKRTWSSVVDWFGTKINSLVMFFSVAWSAIKKVFSTVGSFFSGVWNTISGIFTKVGSTIGNAVSGAFKSAINWVLEKAIGLINGFILSINAALTLINKIPGVNIKTLSLLDVPKLATGGITTGATVAMIGERGKEAVLPLENNTGWMDALADRIASRNSSPSRIALVLDGKELGYATINSINGITRQTGQLQLALV
jgi:phage-related protein